LLVPLGPTRDRLISLVVSDTCRRQPAGFGLLGRAVRLVLGECKRGLDPEPGGFLLAVDALCVDPHQDMDAVTGPLGDLRRLYSGV